MEKSNILASLSARLEAEQALQEGNKLTPGLNARITDLEARLKDLQQKAGQSGKAKEAALHGVNKGAVSAKDLSTARSKHDENEKAITETEELLAAAQRTLHEHMTIELPGNQMGIQNSNCELWDNIFEYLRENVSEDMRTAIWRVWVAGTRATRNYEYVELLKQMFPQPDQGTRDRLMQELKSEFNAL